MSSVLPVYGLWSPECVDWGQEMQKELYGDRMEQGPGCCVFEAERDGCGEGEVWGLTPCMDSNSSTPQQFQLKECVSAPGDIVLSCVCSWCGVHCSQG